MRTKKFYLSILGIMLITISAMSGTVQNQRTGGYNNGVYGQNDRLGYGLAGFGPATFRNVEAEVSAYNLYGGYLWDLNDFASLKGLVEATTDFNKAVFTSLNVGSNFYPIQRNVSPYVGAVIGLTYLGGSEIDDAFGVDGGVSLGAQVFRGASTQMNLEAGIKFLFNEVNDEIPYTYSATIGVLF